MVVGGGYIGLEMAENLARRNLEVTVLEMADQVMSPMDPEMVAPAHAELRRHGVDLCLGEGVAAIEPGPDQRLSVLSSKGQRTVAEMIAMKLLFDPQSGKILGAQAVGRAGVEKRIDVLAVAIQHEATVLDLEEAELCYAPQYGSAKDPVNMAGFVAGNILRGDVDVTHWDAWHALRLTAQEPLVVDVRTRGEAAAGAVPGTINVPLGELRARLGELPRDREIWVHCGVGQRSYYAARILRQHGFRVRNLSGGMRSFQAMSR